MVVSHPSKIHPVPNNSVEARYPGICPRCSGTIHLGERIISTDTGWVHADQLSCSSADDARRDYPDLEDDH